MPVDFDTREVMAHCHYTAVFPHQCQRVELRNK